MTKVSVIIATMNRADALREISLPSLAKQIFKDFEVIIWDASDDDKSKIVVEKFIQSHPDMIIKYFKAPRKGSASQRNDAVKVAKGEIVFFIDDDSEVSENGLEGLKNEFANNKDIMGVGLLLKGILCSPCKYVKCYLRRSYYWIFRLPNCFSKKRRVYLSGWNTLNKNDKTGEAEWLSGCSMAYRKFIFSKFSFQEKLEKFGGYALGEDVYLSHSLFRNGYILKIIDNGYVIHHSVEGGRLESEKKVAAMLYNQYILWKNVIFPKRKISLIVYGWSLIGEITFYGLTGFFPGKHDRIRGILIGLKAIWEERS